MIRAIMTSMDFKNFHYLVPIITSSDFRDFEYGFTGPNIPSLRWVKFKYLNPSNTNKLVIIYGGSLCASNGWRNATKDIVILQKLIRKRLRQNLINRRYQILLSLARHNLNSDVKRLILTY